MEIITKSFLSHGISNAVDGSEDDCVNSDIPPLELRDTTDEQAHELMLMLTTWATRSLMKLTLKTESLLIFSYALHYTAIAVILVTGNYYITHPVMTGRVLWWVGVFSREKPKLSKIHPLVFG